MGIFNFFKKEEREFVPVGQNNDLAKILTGEGLETTTITREMAMQIPSVKASIGYIADLVSSLDIKLYKESDGKVNAVNDDYRLKFLNDETGDLLSSHQMKQALVRDFLLSGNGYVYINKNRNKIESLHYIEPKRVSVVPNNDPVFKDGKILVNGRLYDNYEFVIFAQNSTDGLSGKGLLDESNDLLDLAYNTLAFANGNIKAGGIKRGVVKSAKRLTQEAMDFLKQSWAELYDNNSSKDNKVIILNDGLDFKELSQTSTELQISESRNKNDGDILNILKIPASILNGTATNEQYNNFIKSTIVPILTQLENAFSKALLLESEKEERYFFEFDTRSLLKANTLERFNTYEKAINSGIMTINECRYQENLDPIEGMDIVKMTLAHVLYNPDTKEYYVPNTGQTLSKDGAENVSEKEVNDNGNKEA